MGGTPIRRGSREYRAIRWGASVDGVPAPTTPDGNVSERLIDVGIGAALSNGP